MSLRLYGTISGCGKAAGVVIPSLGSGRYAPGPNIVSPSWLEGEDPNYTINTGWEQPGILAIVSLYPIIDLLQRILPWQPNDAPEEKLAILAQELSQYRLPVEESVQLFAPLFSLPIPEHHYPPLNLSPQRQRQKTLEGIVAVLLEQAERHPVLFIVEDLHWTDPSTLELLNLLIEQIPTASLLVLLTCRPHFQPSWHHRSYLTEMTLNH